MQIYLVRACVYCLLGYFNAIEAASLFVPGLDFNLPGRKHADGNGPTRDS